MWWTSRRARRGREYAERVGEFVATELSPVEPGYVAELQGRDDRWVVLRAA